MPSSIRAFGQPHLQVERGHEQRRNERLHDSDHVVHEREREDAVDRRR
jgi:hypothetical protein